MSYAKKEYTELITKLEQYADIKYKAFNDSLVPGIRPSYGIPVPRLRALAKELAQGDWQGYLACAEDTTNEERMLQGFVIGYIKCEFPVFLQCLSHFIPKIDNWAVCDTVAATLKQVKKHLPEFLDFLRPYLSATEEFQLRFAVVMLMDYYLTPAYIDMVLDTLCHVAHDGYYVKMAVAWALSVCFVKFRDKTLPVIQNNGISDNFTHNKAIQKICESYRISQEDKQLLRGMKRRSE